MVVAHDSVDEDPLAIVVGLAMKVEIAQGGGAVTVMVLMAVMLPGCAVSL